MGSGNGVSHCVLFLGLVSVLWLHFVRILSYKAQCCEAYIQKTQVSGRWFWHLLVVIFSLSLSFLICEM